jgi:hypothetical protein
MEAYTNNGVIVLADDVSGILSASSGSVKITFDDPALVPYKKYLSKEVAKEVTFLHDRVDLYFSRTMVAEVCTRLREVRGMCALHVTAIVLLG